MNLIEINFFFFNFAAHDGKVIIHGGINQDYTKIFDDVAILDTTTKPYTWKVVKTNGAIPPARYSHTATMVGTNMLIAFGIYSFKL